MQKCEYLEKCPIFKKYRMGFIDKVIVKYYCNGIKMDFCRRRKIIKEGKAPPEDLLPNGDTIKAD